MATEIPRAQSPPPTAAANLQGDAVVENNTAQRTPRRRRSDNGGNRSSELRRSPRIVARAARQRREAAAAAKDDLAADLDEYLAADNDVTLCLPVAPPPPQRRGGGKRKYVRDRSGVRKSFNLPKSKRPTDEELFQRQKDHLKRLSEHDKCPSLFQKNGFCKCNCLTILRDDEIREAVANYVFEFQKMDVVDGAQKVVEWFKFASRGKGNAMFPLPTDTNGMTMSADAGRKMNEAMLCTSALGNLLDFGRATLQKCRKLAKNGGAYPKHGNTGKRNKAYKDDSQIVAELRKHFHRLEKLGEVRATRFISRLVHGKLQTGIRDDEEDYIFLPACSSRRSCYFRYLEEQGKKARALGDGSYEIIGDIDGADVKPYVSRSTYNRFWKKEFSHLRITKPSEDICSFCVRMTISITTWTSLSWINCALFWTRPSLLLY